MFVSSPATTPTWTTAETTKRTVSPTLWRSWRSISTTSWTRNYHSTMRRKTNSHMRSVHILFLTSHTTFIHHLVLLFSPVTTTPRGTLCCPGMKCALWIIFYLLSFLLSPGGQFGQTFDLLWILQFFWTAQTHQNPAGYYRLSTQSRTRWAPVPWWRIRYSLLR